MGLKTLEEQILERRDVLSFLPNNVVTIVLMVNSVIDYEQIR